MPRSQGLVNFESPPILRAELSACCSLIFKVLICCRVKLQEILGVISASQQCSAAGPYLQARGGDQVVIVWCCDKLTWTPCPDHSPDCRLTPAIVRMMRHYISITQPKQLSLEHVRIDFFLSSLVMNDFFSLDEVEVVWFPSALALSPSLVWGEVGEAEQKIFLWSFPPSDLRVTQFACLDSGQGESWKKCSRNLNFSQQPEKCWFIEVTTYRPRRLHLVFD